ncbi:MAG: ABC transporter ATP-binding protein/permease [Bacilli bacterium]|nr:ABC transporter ATP-binding protein/permease [Bacilli bacterium]
MPKGAGAGALKRLFSMIIKDYPGFFFLVVIAILIVAFAGVANSYFVGNILIDEFIQPSLLAFKSGVTNDAYSYLLHTATSTTFGVTFIPALIILGSLFIIGVLASYTYNFFMAYIAQGIQKEIRDNLFAHMQDLPVSYFDQHTHGDIMSVYTNDVDSLREMLARSIPMMTSSLVTMFAVTIMMLITDFYLSIVVFLVGALMFMLTKFFASRSGRHFVKMQMELGRTNGYIEEMISGQKVVKVFNYEEKNIEEFKKHNEELFTQSVKANRYANILMPVVNQLGNLQYAILALIGGLFVVNAVNGYGFGDMVSGGHIYTIGVITSFLLYTKSFTQPIGQMAQQLNTVTMALAGASRIFSMTDEKTEVDEGYVELVNAKEDENGNPVEVSEHTGKWAWKHPHTDGSKTTYTWLKGKINVNGVDFGYVPNKIVLHDITVYAEPGQKIAFVGPTGAGKTTITNLLNRFYDIADGKIRYDDININKIKKADLRRSLGMVFQDTKLFTGTVMENIRYGKLDASDEEVYKAAKLANADTFIQQLPEGYNTVLKNGGASLSQGQRQLLAIARAAIANPPVLILDEATSSIDSRTEAMVTKGMDAIMEGRTVFVIAHRLSTIKNSDVIMVLDHGHIIERGSHDALLAQKGKYYQLYTGNAIAD